MGLGVDEFDSFVTRDDSEGRTERLGDVLSGRLEGVRVDSVEAVRDVRERK